MPSADAWAWAETSPPVPVFFAKALAPADVEPVLLLLTHRMQLVSLWLVTSLVLAPATMLTSLVAWISPPLSALTFEPWIVTFLLLTSASWPPAAIPDETLRVSLSVVWTDSLP